MSGRFTDVSFHLRAAWNRQHILNGGPPEALVPGWFLRVSRNEGHEEVLPECQIAPRIALAFAGCLEEVIAEALLAQGFSPTLLTAAVSLADREMEHELRRQLEAAEVVAARIPRLRAALGLTTGGPDA